MELTGRITADAKVATIEGDRQVVNFSIAINDRYKPKGSDTVRELVTYVNCSYWRSSAIAKYLVKGMLVELSGHVSVNAWLNAQGDAKASLNFHVKELKLHGKSSKSIAVTDAPAEITKPVEDLPF